MSGIHCICAGSGGEGPLPNWTDITGSDGGDTNVQTMYRSGTLNFSLSGGGLAAPSYIVVKNGVSQGSAASISVVPGDTVRFQVNITGTPGQSYSGTFTITGVYADTFSVTLSVS